MLHRVRFQSRLTKLQLALAIPPLIILGVIAWFIFAYITEGPPTFFPLNNSQAEYRITQSCPSLQGMDVPSSFNDYGFCVEYKGTGVLMDEDRDKRGFFRITVGKSQVDLEPINGKKVKNIRGKFTYRRQQCIQDSCYGDFGPAAVLDIYSLELAE
ncbi:MAG TPA: hypothetical protein VD999_06765 [Vitreimonas sp.]|nr:hypothetical protein [Vitreimonas sp.]